MSKALGRIFDNNGELYIFVYSTHNTAYKITWLEAESVKGYRIVGILYGYYVDDPCNIGENKLYSDIRYGLIDSKNNLVTQCDFFSLSRIEDGRINAEYPDPRNDGRKTYDKKERFNCVLSYSGRPLFKYFSKDNEGHKSIKYQELRDEIVAVSRCYHGIALFVKNHKIGIVDFNGVIKLEAKYSHIDLQKYHNCFKAYKVKYSSLIGPDALDISGDTYIFSTDKSSWPISFQELDSKYSIVKYFSDDIYILKNKQTSRFCLCFKGRWPFKRTQAYYSDEYTQLKKVSSFNNPEESFFIASDTNKKKGLICVHKEKSKISDFEILIRKEVLICPFEYDQISESSHNYLIITKNNHKGIFSLNSKTIIVDCVIPDKVGVLPFTIGEGYVGCYRKTEDCSSGNIFYFSDMEGHEIIPIDSKWIIKSGFKDGYAKIESDKEYAVIDNKGNITITADKHSNKDSNTHDYDWGNEDYERDNWDAMTDGMFGDYPDEGLDGDYEVLGY